MPSLRTLIGSTSHRGCLALALTLALAAPGQTAPQYVNSIVIPGKTLDQSGGTGVNTGRFGAFSDLYYIPAKNEWLGLADRGPGGGTISYETRVNRFSLDVNKTTGAISNFQIKQTVLFRNGGISFNGLAPNLSGSLGNALDPEGIVALPKTGNYLVSDEYGPSVYEFSPGGSFIRAYETPANLVPKAAGSVNYSAAPAPGSLTAGREGNRGLEGLAVSPSGDFAFAMLQNGTVTDGNVSGGNFARSMYTRIIKYNTSTGKVVGQYAYKLDGAGPAPSQARGISAIVALDENRFLVLERNNRGVGVNSDLNPPDKKVYLVDLANATDVSSMNLNTQLPIGVAAASKTTTFVNLAANTLPEFNNRSPEKWEGLAIGPRLDDGSYLMLAGTDNDYSVTQNNSNTQFDVFFNAATGQRAQCDLGLTTNCTAITSTGTLGASLGDLPDGYQLIPSVLQSYKVSTQDLGGYTPPTSPVPGPLPLLGTVAALSWSRRLRRRLRSAAAAEHS